MCRQDCMDAQASVWGEACGVRPIEALYDLRHLMSTPGRAKRAFAGILDDKSGGRGRHFWVLALGSEDDY